MEGFLTVTLQLFFKPLQEAVIVIVPHFFGFNFPLESMDAILLSEDFHLIGFLGIVFASRTIGFLRYTVVFAFNFKEGFLTVTLQEAVTPLTEAVIVVVSAFFFGNFF